ncbi:17615_t:CDS:2, partial [Entrophospora sp. SA101]
TNFPKCCFKPAVLANQRIHGQYANMNSSRSDTANSNIRSCQPIEVLFDQWKASKYSSSEVLNSSRSDTANSNIRSCQPIEGDYPIWSIIGYNSLLEPEKLVWCKNYCENMFMKFFLINGKLQNIAVV